MILETLFHTTAEMTSIFPAQVPDPAPIAPPGSDKFINVMAWGKWVALAIAVLGLFVAGGMMAINSRRGEGSEHAGRLGWVLVGVIVISSGGAIVGFLAT